MATGVSVTQGLVEISVRQIYVNCICVTMGTAYIPKITSHVTAFLISQDKVAKVKMCIFFKFYSDSLALGFILLLLHVGQG